MHEAGRRIVLDAFGELENIRISGVRATAALTILADWIPVSAPASRSCAVIASLPTNIVRRAKCRLRRRRSVRNRLVDSAPCHFDQ
jgi:hypothetical protein